MQDQRLAEEHHGERLARAGGVPDHPTFSPAIGAFLVDTLDQPLDAKHLLVAGDDLARLLVKQGEQAGHLQQPIRGEQADEQAVLIADSQLASRNQRLIPVQIGGGPVAKQGRELFG
ncbi:hypothetical protein D3C87_1376610 [compost metagenome]